jgi:hypothetical protein
MRKEYPLSIINKVQELLCPKGFLTYLIRVQDVTDLEYLVFEKVQLDADPLAKVLDPEALHLHQVFQMIRMPNECTLVAHQASMLFAVVVYLHVRVLITEDINWSHLRLELLNVVQVLLRDVMNDAIKGALQLAIQGLKEEVEAVQAQLIPTGEDEHLPVDFVIQFVAVRAIVPTMTVG